MVETYFQKWVLIFVTLSSIMMFTSSCVDGPVERELIDGNIYTGDLKDGKFDGFGILEFANGNKYEGEFRLGEFNGEGVLTFKNGNKYDGEFKDGRFDGKGVIKYANGSSYSGEFGFGEYKEYNGYGVFVWSDNIKYEGEWRNGMKNGKGIITTLDGELAEVKEGIWLNDKLIEEKIQAKPLNEIYKEVKSAVTSIFIETDMGEIAQRSGFFVSKDGILITNLHVLENAQTIVVLTEDEIKYDVIDVLYSDDINDIAILKVNHPSNSNFNFLEIAEYKPEIGEECFAIGSPLGLGGTLSKGNISSFRNSDKLINYC